MRSRLLALAWAAAAALCSVGCVSSRLVEANAEAVRSLAEVAVAADPAARPDAAQAEDTAAALVEASGWLAQIFNLGLPTALVNENALNVERLSVYVRAPTQEDLAAIEAARARAAELAGKARERDRGKDAAAENPVLALAMAGLALVGEGIYLWTRGRKHISKWWNEPGGAPPATDPPRTWNDPGPATASAAPPTPPGASPGS